MGYRVLFFLLRRIKRVFLDSIQCGIFEMQKNRAAVLRHVHRLGP
jgi:hypothetical protein